MTLFIDLRASANGGIVADQATAWDGGNTPMSAAEFERRIDGRDLLLATHGFNVDRQDGMAALSNWSLCCALPDNVLFVGVLWPGDSSLLPVVDYIYEGIEAIASGKLLADWLNRHAGLAQSLSFASHSLGARVVLQTVRGLKAQPRHVILMAGAIENDCLVREYQDAAARAGNVFVVASRSDIVLEWAFPAGNLVGEILMHGHPYDRTALGRNGPGRPLPAGMQVSSWQIPDGWDYGHGDYLPRAAVGWNFAVPIAAPGPQSPPPADSQDPAHAGWKPAWSAATLASKARQP